MKVLALSYLFPNSAQREYGIFVFNRLKAVQQFCEVKVIAPLQNYPLRSVLRPELPSIKGSNSPSNLDGVEVWYPYFFVIPRYLKVFDAFSYYLAVRPVVKRMLEERFHFDLVDAHWTYPDILAAYLIARRCCKPFVVTIRGREALYLGENSGRKWLLDKLLKKADAVVALSSELKGLVEEIGVPGERVRVILNGVNQTNFRPMELGEARRVLGLAANRVNIVSVGSLVERKGHHELIRLMPQLSEKRDVFLYIIGSAGPEGDFSVSLKTMAAESAPGRIHFVEGVGHEQLRYWYNAADLFCLATKGEGCPNVVLEALSCGTPVVVTDVGAVRDIVMEGVNGYIATGLEELEQKIDAALATRWDRTAIAEAMRRFTWEGCAEEVVELYREILQRRDVISSSTANGVVQ